MGTCTTCMAPRSSKGYAQMEPRRPTGGGEVTGVTTTTIGGATTTTTTTATPAGAVTGTATATGGGGGARGTSPLDGLPEKVLIGRVGQYLTQFEVVRGLGETARRFAELVRGAYGVEVDVLPFEEVPKMRKIEGVLLRSTEWGRRGVKYDEFMAGIKRGWNGCFSLQDAANHFDASPDSETCGLSVFPLANMQTLPLKSLTFEGIRLDAPDLLALQAVASLESLSFVLCFFSADVEIFPPNLKKLSASCQYSSHESVRIGGFPETLESLDLHRFRVTATVLPPGLLNLEISHLGDIESLPFEFPMKIKSLKVDSMYNLQTLPSLSTLESLESFVLNMCHGLRAVPTLPQSVRKLRMEWCKKVETITLPYLLEELKCARCDSLDIDLSNLPPQLKRLTLESCNKMGEIKKLPLNLEELSLKDFEKILPDLPQSLRSFTLTKREHFINLPALPEALQNLCLDELAGLKTLPALPEGLESFSLSCCEQLKAVDRFPRKLKSLTIRDMVSLRITDPHLPDSLKSLVFVNVPKASLNITQFPVQLECLRLRNLSGIDALPSFPPTLSTLDLSSMATLKALPTFPDALLKLSLEDCGSIINFPSLPPELRALTLRRCDQIRYVGLETGSSKKVGIRGKFPESLRSLSLSWCKLETIGPLPVGLRRLSFVGCIQDQLFLSNLPRNLKELEIRDFDP